MAHLIICRIFREDNFSDNLILLAPKQETFKQRRYIKRLSAAVLTSKITAKTEALFRKMQTINSITSWFNTKNPRFFFQMNPLLPPRHFKTYLMRICVSSCPERKIALLHREAILIRSWQVGSFWELIGRLVCGFPWVVTSPSRTQRVQNVRDHLN